MRSCLCRGVLSPPSSTLERGPLGRRLGDPFVVLQSPQPPACCFLWAPNPAKPRKQSPKGQHREQHGWGKAMVTARRAKGQKFGLEDLGGFAASQAAPSLVVTSGFILGVPPLCGRSGAPHNSLSISCQSLAEALAPWEAHV